MVDQVTDPPFAFAKEENAFSYLISHRIILI